MRSDMAKVVTERPRRGHGNPGKKWGRRLGKNEHDAEDGAGGRWLEKARIAVKIAIDYSYNWYYESQRG